MRDVWFCEFGGQAAGPFSLERLREMAADGRVTRDMLVRRADWTGWARAAQVPELRGAFFAKARPWTPLAVVLAIVLAVVLGLLAWTVGGKWFLDRLVTRANGDKGHKSADVDADKSRMRAAAGQGRRLAVIIGVNRYLDQGIESLRYCVADARLIEKTLVDKCGYDPNDILVIADDADRDHFLPLRLNINQQLAAWIARARPEDTVLVFFSGHGFLDAQQRGYLAPKDCERDNLAATSVPTERIREALRAAPARRKLLVLDCCHAGGSKMAERAGPSSEELGGAFLQGEGLLTLASCRKQESSKEWDKVGHGLFTYHLAQGLGGAADYDGDGLVDSGEIYKYVATEVTRTAQIELNTRQTPVELRGDDVFGVFALAKTDTRRAAESSPAAVEAPVNPRHAPPMGARAGEEWSANGLKMKFCWCPDGVFTMGSPPGEAGRTELEKQVTVRLTRGFWLAKHELTQGDWQAIMGTQPWSENERVRKGSTYPATCVAWQDPAGDDVDSFLKKWNASEGRSGRLSRGWAYRLPTEAQWEYACRAGEPGPYCFGGDASKVGDYAWSRENAIGAGEDYPHEVGLKKANRWQLHDMHGNAWEWCQDAFQPNLPGGTDPLVSMETSGRVVRGGGFNFSALHSRSAHRDKYSTRFRYHDLGFRLALVFND